MTSFLFKVFCASGLAKEIGTKSLSIQKLNMQPSFMQLTATENRLD